MSGYRQVDSGGGSTKINASGFYDPTFGLTWRAIDQRAHGMNLDLYGTYAPDVFGSHTGTRLRTPASPAAAARVISAWRSARRTVSLPCVET